MRQDVVGIHDNSNGTCNNPTEGSAKIPVLLVSLIIIANKILLLLFLFIVICCGKGDMKLLTDCTWA